MTTVPVEALSKAIRQLTGLHCMFLGMDEGVMNDKVPPELVEKVNNTAEMVRIIAERGGFWDVAEQVGVFLSRPRAQMTCTVFMHDIRHLLDQTESGLRKVHFWVCPEDHQSLLTRWKPMWFDITSAIPECHDDVEAAHQAYAYGLATASIFHSIRVFEHGLRKLAKKVGVKIIHSGKAQDLETADWHKIITNSRNRVNVLRAKRKTLKNEALIVKYNAAIDSCDLMKDLRNEVSHCKKKYIDPEALAAIQRTHEFMKLIVQIA